METTKQGTFYRNKRVDRLVLALTLVAAGVVILCHNLGLMSYYLFRILISWQMLMIIFGISAFIKRNYLLSVLFFCIGFYFLLPRIAGGDTLWLCSFWPMFLILGGLVLFFRRNTPSFHRHGRGRFPGEGEARSAEESTDGFVNASISFGNNRHIVLDPVFRGANLDASFGSITLDLRRTRLEDPETHIHVNCSFGSIEVLLPPHWCVVSEVANAIGSCEDKRYTTQAIDTAHKLIIRGNVSFGALEIKN
ncbi:MAG: cell wall-active antibiotics response protein [Tannerellaceae bacterium]|jgi:predicted membrane protein|nr:cell wall-active antibiotics response protein [Tannerellaceae bacterium]